MERGCSRFFLFAREKDLVYGVNLILEKLVLKLQTRSSPCKDGKGATGLFGRKNLIFIILSVQRNLCAGFRQPKRIMERVSLVSVHT